MRNLTDEDREALACVATGHEPDLCDCHDGYRDVGDKFCEYAQETFAAAEAIIARHVEAERERVAQEIEALSPPYQLAPMAIGCWSRGRDDAARTARETGRTEEEA